MKFKRILYPGFQIRITSPKARWAAFLRRMIGPHNYVKKKLKKRKKLEPKAGERPAPEAKPKFQNSPNNQTPQGMQGDMNHTYLESWICFSSSG